VKLEKYLTLYSLPAAAITGTAAVFLAVDGVDDMILFAAPAAGFLTLGSATGYFWWSKRRQGKDVAVGAPKP
jgi:energy-converting hydrogenase Eha subunit C